jgi:hypothetical protein
VTYLVIGLVVAAAVVVVLALVVRQSIGSGALGQYVVPYAEPASSDVASGAATSGPGAPRPGLQPTEFVGGGVWTWGVRASPPLVRLVIDDQEVRLGPSSSGWSFLIRSLVVPRTDLLSVAIVDRRFGVQAVRFSVVGATFAFIGPADDVMAAIAARWASA